MFHLAIFSGNTIDGSMIEPGERVTALALFGGLKFDFLDAPAPPDAELTIIALFGGATVKVRPDEPVELTGFSLFGARTIEPRRALSAPSALRPRLARATAQMIRSRCWSMRSRCSAASP